MGRWGTLSLGGTLWGGLLAGTATALFVYLYAGIIGLQLGDTVRFLGSIVAQNTPRATAAGGVTLAAMAFVWAFVYRLVADALPEPAAKKGLLFGAAIWLFSTALLWPLLSTVRLAAGEPGVLALGFGGWKAASTSLLAHLVYGTVLARIAPVADR